MSFAFQIQGLEGQTPDNVVFTCKETPEQDEALFAVSRADSITEVYYDADKDIRVYRVRIPPYLTEDIDTGRYYYDLQCNVNNDIITLMIGRLTIEPQITTGAVSPDPPYDNGDYILYPKDNVPSTSTKVYHELPISNIGAYIKSINGSEDTYTTADMSDALIAIKGDIVNISNSINLIIGGYEEIPLSDMSSIIYNQLGLYYDDGTEVLY
jgi:hypothetical protein